MYDDFAPMPQPKEVPPTPCERCGTLERPWNLTLDRDGSSVCRVCAAKDARYRRTKLVFTTIAIMTLVVATVVGVQMRRSYLAGPHYAMRQLREAIAFHDEKTVDRYVDYDGLSASTLGTDRSFRGLWSAIVGTRALSTIVVTSVSGDTARAEGVAMSGFGVRGITVEYTLKRIATKDGPVWRVIGVANAAELERAHAQQEQALKQAPQTY